MFISQIFVAISARRLELQLLDELFTRSLELHQFRVHLLPLIAELRRTRSAIDARCVRAGMLHLASTLLQDGVGCSLLIDNLEVGISELHALTS